MTQGKMEKDARGLMTDGLEAEASETFVQRLQGEWTPESQTALEQRLQNDTAYANAYRRVQESWVSLDTHAQSPRLMALRSEALDFARRTHGRRWLKSSPYTRARWRLAASIAISAVLALASAWQFLPFGFRPGEYRTAIGQQRILELQDDSRVALDAASRLRVRFTDETRLVELEQGQAQFSVAKDLNRPFKVRAGGQTIVALGTVFTVEYVGGNVHVAMLEGKVAILLPAARLQELPQLRPVETQAATVAPIRTQSIELSAGQEIRIPRSGQATLSRQADLEAATAWREGKVIFRTESLGEAVRRLNRYSHIQIEVDDPKLAARNISGVFETGDTKAFLTAIQRIYPVKADQSDSGTIHLTLPQ
jgi:transmembrane sensor